MTTVQVFDLSSDCILIRLNLSELKQVKGGVNWSNIRVIQGDAELQATLDDYQKGLNKITLVGNDPWGNNAIYFDYPGSDSGDPPSTLVVPL